MDQNVLVSGGGALVKAMDASNLSPRLAMWVHNTDADTWKLWLLPPAEYTDKTDFYRRISQIISKNRNEFGGIDASDTEMVSDSHPAVQGLKNFIRVDGLSNVHFSGNRFNNFYLPEGIILRSRI